jgi:hypothetical protein
MQRTKRRAQSRRMFSRFSHAAATSQEDRRTPRPGRAQKILAHGNLSLDIVDQG